MAYAPARPAPPVQALPVAKASGVTGRLATLPLPLLAAGLGLITILSRIPFRSRYLFSWDSANFALALEHYNVAFHQPQPPGYPLYVASAHLLTNTHIETRADLRAKRDGRGLAGRRLNLEQVQVEGARDRIGDWRRDGAGGHRGCPL